MPGNLEGFFLECLTGSDCRSAGNNRAAAGIGAGAVRGQGGVATHDPDILKPDPQGVTDELSQGGLMPLALRGNAERSGDRPRRVYPQERRLGPGRDRHARRNRNGRAHPG